eukprot:TRINITY_DN30365_c0_g1_i1.p1 TRINITY_DN30365_c0_g1~~TRINITY_DN30365_c0_g1_i1.p1  ORF type:complete len:1067 (+),score=262.81 TRINITY_DN30365_c0_g1_i1:42-3242(+)
MSETGLRRKPTRKKTAPPAREELTAHNVLLNSAWSAVQENKICTPTEFTSLWEYAQLSGKMVRVDEEWLQMVHYDSTSDKKKMWTKLRSLMTDPGQDTTAGKPLMEEVHSIVAQGVGLLAPDVNTFVFPGPMAVPLTTRLNRFLTANSPHKRDYWLTEKSDGLRTMLFSKNISHPRWYSKTAGGMQVLSLYDMLLVETTYQTLLKKKQTQSKSGMPLSKAMRGEQVLALQLDQETQVCYLVDTVTNKRAQLSRNEGGEGLGLAYVFDRSCDVYLLLDEVTVPGESTLVDGELITNLKTGNTDYIIYDVVMRGATTYGTANMSARIKCMQELVQRRNEHLARGRKEPMFDMRVKEFYPSDQIEKLLSFIVKEDEYIYKGENKNDGVVLTPEAGHLVPFRPGTCGALLKWKHPDTLTVDWHVKLASRTDQGRKFTLSYNVKDKAPGGEWYEEACDFDVAPLLARKGVCLSDVPQVVECKFLSEQGYWLVTNVRNDKKAPNSYLTVASVLESQAENYNSERLQNILLKGQSSVRQGKVSMNQFERPFCCFILRTHRDPEDPTARRLTLQLRAKTRKYNYPRSFSYIAAEEVFGLDCRAPATDKTSPLLHLLFIELANKGGCAHWSNCVCEAKFDPMQGRWEVLGININTDEGTVKNRATVRGVIRHLEEVCRHGMSKYTAAQTGVEPVRDAIVPSDTHYASRALDGKLEIDRSSLRGFNNWVKTVSITEYVSAGAPDHVISPDNMDKIGARHLVALDLCCGRGGDLHKWTSQKPKLYIGADSCLPAVGVAAKRYSDLFDASVNNKSRSGMPARFLVTDCFSKEGCNRIHDALRKKRETAFNCISCQFSLHYSFRSEELAATMMQNISSLLEEGGIFFGTIVDSEELLRRKDKHGPTFGNGSYSVAFKEGEGEGEGVEGGLYGQTYTFSLESCVEEEDEYIIHWDNFVKLAAKHDLELHTAYSFKEFYQRFISEERYEAVWNRFFTTPLTENIEESSSKRLKLSSPSFIPTSPNIGATDAPVSPPLEPSLLELSESKVEESDLLQEYLTEQEMEASFIYKTFAFKKVART